MRRAQNEESRNLLMFLAATQYYRGGLYQDAARLAERIAPTTLPANTRNLLPDFLRDVRDRSSAGYVARNHLLACLNMLTVDACVSPKGDLVVAVHSGAPDWGSGPGGKGRLYKISYTGKGLAHLKDLKALTRLNLWASQFNDDDTEYLKELKNLKILNLWSTKITDKGLENLKGLQSLEDLSLMQTEVTDKGLQSLKGLEKLNRISLFGTKVADECVDSLKEMKGLTSVDLQQTKVTKFDPTVEVNLRLGVDPRRQDQMVRGTVNLPNGTGKTARVLVFATGDKAAEAEAAGADFVGSDDLIERIQGGFLDFDAVVATPDLMGKVGRLGRVLGPRGLMPNPKTGTVTPDVGKAVTDIKGGKIEFRVDRNANLHFIIGKTSFSDTNLVENYAAAIDEVLRLKPSAAKGRYVKKATFATTMGPGIQVDPNKTRNLLAEDADA